MRTVPALPEQAACHIHMFGPRRSRQRWLSHRCQCNATTTRERESNGTFNVHVQYYACFLARSAQVCLLPMLVDDRQYSAFVNDQEERERLVWIGRSCLICFHHHDMYIWTDRLLLERDVEETITNREKANKQGPAQRIARDASSVSTQQLHHGQRAGRIFPSSSCVCTRTAAPVPS